MTRRQPTEQANVFSLDSLSFEVTLHDGDMTLTDQEATIEQPTDDTLTADEDLYVDPTPLSWLSAPRPRVR